MRLILASASPRRVELLESAGYVFDVQPADVDETPLPDEEPDAYVERLARLKASTVWERSVARGERLDDLVVLGADTIVVLDGQILGKPRDDEEARRMLRSVAGRDHEVLTGVAVRAQEGEWARVERTRVTFLPMSDTALDEYISTGEGRDKAGAYGIQGAAARFVEQIDGSYTNVVGLPVEAVSDILTTYRSRKSL